MPQRRIKTDEFGVMTLDSTTGYYECKVDLPYMKSNRIYIASEGFELGLKRMHEFLAWLEVNHQAFKLLLEREIQNYDLVWDDVWDSILGEGWVDAEEGFLAEYLIYNSVHYNGANILLWINTSGLHTDHMIRVTINEKMEIKRCEML